MREDMAAVAVVVAEDVLIEAMLAFMGAASNFEGI